MKTVYIIVDEPRRRPCAVASTPERALELLHEFVDLQDGAEYLGFTPYNEETGGDCIYEGIHKYRLTSYRKGMVLQYIQYKTVLDETEK